ncbi:hypothetical protein KKG48_00975 [Patescibacteria group bacterium]|nr:hypothetical protein [Patescibacteria group bacterium]MCG2695241.1 hypothetical protein [Candidatus Parcubacteria bacterium]
MSERIFKNQTDLVMFIVAISAIRPEHEYGGRIAFPKLKIGLNFNVTSIIPLSKLGVKNNPTRIELLPFLFQIKIMNDEGEIRLRKDEYEFFYNILALHIYDANLKIKERIIDQSSVNPKNKLCMIGRAFPIGATTTETYNLVVRTEDVPQSLREEIFIE